MEIDGLIKQLKEEKEKIEESLFFLEKVKKNLVGLERMVEKPKKRKYVKSGKGIPLSEEHKEKIRKAQLKVWKKRKGKKR